MASDDEINSPNNNKNYNSNSPNKNPLLFNSNNEQNYYNDSDVVSLFDSPTSDRGAIPEDLRKVLIDFSVACIVNQPRDYIDYGVKYFRAIQDNRLTGKRSLRKLPIPSTMSLVKVSSKHFGKRERRDISQASLNRGDADGMSISEAEMRNAPAPERRKSVYATSYDPCDDDETAESEEEVELFPKRTEQRQRIKNAFERVFQFHPIESEQMEQAINAMYSRRVEYGENIIERGDDSEQNFYVIESGKFHAYVDDKVVFGYDNEGSFGEMALLYRTEPDATIRAETEGLLWVMDGPTFQRILLKSSARKRKVYEALLNNVPLLKVLKPKELLNLADALIPQTYKKDERIIKQGEVGNGMYFIEEGQVAVKIEWEVGQGEQYITSLQRGAYFGEIALLTNGPRMASIYAEVDDTKLAFLEKNAFERLLGKCVDLLKRGLREYNNVNLLPYLNQLDMDAIFSDN